MIVNVQTSKNFDFSVEITNSIKQKVMEKLARHEQDITRVEVHLSDQNGEKYGQETCRVEVRLKGAAPIATHSTTDNHRVSLNKALSKAASILDRHHDKKSEHRTRRLFS